MYILYHGWQRFATENYANQNAKLSAFLNGRLVRRLWLPCDTLRPSLRGGADDRFYLPAPWFEEGENRLALLVEAVEMGGEAEISALSFRPGE
jgi:beta-galactosidase